MKSIFVSALLILSACSSASIHSKNQLQFSRLETLRVGISTKSEVLAFLGSPTGTNKKDGYESVFYDDPKSGLQRLSLDFNLKTQKLTSFFWIPQPGEKEISLEFAKSIVKDAKFTEEVFGLENPHSSANEFLLKDPKAGVSIIYFRGEQGNSVELISFADPSLREPATKEKSKKIPYTIGDDQSAIK